jgi:hypothetical protein
MPQEKIDDIKHTGAEAEIIQSADTTPNGRKFPPEAYAYDTDVTDAGIERVKAEAEKRLKNDKWVVVDGDTR